MSGRTYHSTPQADDTVRKPPYDMWQSWGVIRKGSKKWKSVKTENNGGGHSYPIPESKLQPWVGTERMERCKWRQTDDHWLQATQVESMWVYLVSAQRPEATWRRIRETEVQSLFGGGRDGWLKKVWSTSVIYQNQSWFSPSWQLVVDVHLLLRHFSPFTSCNTLKCGRCGHNWCKP